MDDVGRAGELLGPEEPPVADVLQVPEAVEVVDVAPAVEPVGTLEAVDAAETAGGVQQAPQPPAAGQRRGRLVLLIALGLALLVAGTAIGYAVSRPTVSDLESRLTAASSETAVVKADVASQKAKLTAAQASLTTCVSAAGTATTTLASWASYLDAVQQLYRAESNAQADKALALMAKRYRKVVEQTVPTNEALQGCTKTATS